jgi:putative membrane protein
MRTLTVKALALACALSQVAILAVSAADSTNNSHGSFSESDYHFAANAASGGTLEIALGKVAADKASDPAVKQFGQKMVDDHTKAGDALGKIASQKGATLPMELTAAQQKHIDKLSAMSGADFDKAYINMMVRAHKGMLKEFKHASENCDDNDLKMFAANTEPTVQEHLTAAEGLKTNEK